MSFDLEQLPEGVRPLMALCLQLSPAGLGHQSNVFDYLRVNEVALAAELIITGAERDLDSDERGLIVKHLREAYIELWAAPGAADAWVEDLCARRENAPPGA